MKVLRVTRTLGSVFKVFAAFLALPILASLYWDTDVPESALAGMLHVPLKETTASFLVTFLFVFLLGFLLTTLAERADEDLREREAFFIVGAGWLLCSLLGALPFLLTRATRNVTVAVFEAMSGLTTTGFTALAAPLEQYAPSVHVWRGTLHFFGGLGIVLVAVAVIGRLTEGAVKLLSMETGAGEVSRIRPKLSQTAKSLFALYLSVNAAAFVAFWVALHATGPHYDWKTGAYHALVHSLGTVATGGMSTRTDSVAAFASPTLNALMFVAMFVGGTSFPLMYRALHGGFRAFWHSVELRFYVAVVVLSSALAAGFLLVAGHAPGFAAAYAPFTVLTTLTTTGYTATNPDLFPDGAKLLLLLLMFTGAMVGSTAGGIKISRIYLLLGLTYRELQKLLHPHAVSSVKLGGRLFPEESMRRVVVFFFCYVTFFIGGALAFAVLGLDLASSLSASAASLGNVGYGFGAVAPGFADPMSDLGRLVGVALMWVGRLEIFAVLLLFVPGTYRD